jgi:hypothetical protein
VMNYGLRLCEFKLVPHPQQNHRLSMSINSMGHQASLVPDAPPSQPAVAQDVRGQKKRPSARGGQAAGAKYGQLGGECGIFPSCHTHVTPWCSRGSQILPRLVHWSSQIFQLGCNARLSACCLNSPNASGARVHIHGSALAIRSDSSERIGPPTTFNYRDVAIAAIADNSPCLIAG